VLEKKEGVIADWKRSYPFCHATRVVVNNDSSNHL